MINVKVLKNSEFYICWPMPLFLIFYFTDWYCDGRRVHFTYSNFACVLHVVVFLARFWSCIDMIEVRVKVSRGIVPFFPMGIDSADISQPPNGEICMDKSHLLLNNPDRQ